MINVTCDNFIFGKWPSRTTGHAAHFPFFQAETEHNFTLAHCTSARFKIEIQDSDRIKRTASNSKYMISIRTKNKHVHLAFKHQWTWRDSARRIRQIQTSKLERKWKSQFSEITTHIDQDGLFVASDRVIIDCQNVSAWNIEVFDLSYIDDLLKD